MRLVDRIMQSDREGFARDPRGAIHPVPGAGAAAGDLEECATRYIIDPAASSQCADLLRREADLLAPDNPMLRAPARLFWMEWFHDEFADDRPAQRLRLGVLVAASDTGRSGTLRYFFDDPAGEAGQSPLRIEFDLDLAPRADPSRNRFRLSHGDIGHIDILLRHSVLVVDQAWAASLLPCTAQERRAFVHAHANSMWMAFPLMLAFGALLGDKRVLRDRKSDFGRLNAARTKQGKRALLDHIEVSMNLGEMMASAPVSGPRFDARSTPRLHYVRGHPVHRAGKTFWRTAHFRGDLDRPIARRTVDVRGVGIAR